MFPIHHSTNHNTYSHDAYNYKGLKNMIRSSNSPLRIAIIAHSLYPIAQPYAGGLEMITQFWKKGPGRTFKPILCVLD